MKIGGKMKAIVNYYRLKAGNRYKVVDSGFDYYVVSHRGGVIYVPYWVFSYARSSIKVAKFHK